MTELVYRTQRGRVWHWARTTRLRGTVTCCTGVNVINCAQVTPGVPLMEDRCSGAGCREQWADWVRATIVATQADEINRLRQGVA